MARIDKKDVDSMFFTGSIDTVVGADTQRRQINFLRTMTLSRFMAQRDSEGNHAPYHPRFMPQTIYGRRFPSGECLDLLVSMSNHPEWQTPVFFLQGEIEQLGLSTGDSWGTVVTTAETESHFDRVFNLDETNIRETNPDLYRECVKTCGGATIDSAPESVENFRELIARLSRTSSQLRPLKDSFTEQADALETVNLALTRFTAETLSPDGIREDFIGSLKIDSAAIDRVQGSLYSTDFQLNAQTVADKVRKINTQFITAAAPAVDPKGRSIEDHIKRLYNVRFSTKGSEHSSIAELQEAIRPWSEKLGLNIHLLRSKEDLPDSEKDQYPMLEKVESGKTKYAPKGWYNTLTGEVFFYAPCCSVRDIDELVLHEVVAHKGLPELLGRDNYGALCELTYESVMSEEDRHRKLIYVASLMPQYNEIITLRTRFEELPPEMQDSLENNIGLRRDAANEYIAELAQKGVRQTKWSQQWEKFILAVKKVLLKVGIKVKIETKDLETLLSASMAKMSYDAAKRNNPDEKPEPPLVGRPARQGSYTTNFMMADIGGGAEPRILTDEKLDEFCRRAADYEHSVPGSGEALNEFMGENYSVPLSRKVEISLQKRKNPTLSPLSAHRFSATVQGRDITFNSFEQYFQYSRAIFAGDKHLANQLLLSGPQECRIDGRSVRKLDRKAWSAQEGLVIMEGVRAMYRGADEEDRKDFALALCSTGAGRLVYSEESLPFNGAVYADALRQLRSSLLKEDEYAPFADNNRVTAVWSAVTSDNGANVNGLLAGDNIDFVTPDGELLETLDERKELGEALASNYINHTLAGALDGYRMANALQQYESYVQTPAQAHPLESVEALVKSPEFETVVRSQIERNSPEKYSNALTDSVSALSPDAPDVEYVRAFDLAWSQMSSYEKATVYNTFYERSVALWWDGLGDEDKLAIAAKSMNLKSYLEGIKENLEWNVTNLEFWRQQSEAFGMWASQEKLDSIQEQMASLQKEIDATKELVKHYQDGDIVAVNDRFNRLGSIDRRNCYKANGPADSFLATHADMEAFISGGIPAPVAEKTLDEFYAHLEEYEQDIKPLVLQYKGTYLREAQEQETTFESLPLERKLDIYTSSILPEAPKDLAALFGLTDDEYRHLCEQKAYEAGIRLEGDERLYSRSQALGLWKGIPVAKRLELYDAYRKKTDVEALDNSQRFAQMQQSVEQTFNGQCTLYSGGADGSDSYWGYRASGYGIPVVHFYAGTPGPGHAPKGNTQISQADFEEGAVEIAKAAKRSFGYPYPKVKNDLLIRDWAQVKYSDAVFAVGTVITRLDLDSAARRGESVRVNPDKPTDERAYVNPTVTGGTGYAVNAAILHDKPVYVFDQNRRHWFTYNAQTNDFEPVSLSKINKKFNNIAGIGTRELNAAGKKAIAEFMRYYANLHNLKALGNTENRYDKLVRESNEWWDSLDEAHKLRLYPLTRRNELTLVAAIQKREGFPRPVTDFMETAQTEADVQRYAKAKYEHQNPGEKFEEVPNELVPDIIDDAWNDLAPLFRLGYSVGTPDGQSVGKDDVVRNIARNQQETYAKERMDAGWVFGTKATLEKSRNVVRKFENGIVTERVFSDSDKRYDPLLNYFELLPEPLRKNYLSKADSYIENVLANGLPLVRVAPSAFCDRVTPNIGKEIRETSLDEAQRWWNTQADDAKIALHLKAEPLPEQEQKARSVEAPQAELEQKASTPARDIDTYISQQEILIANKREKIKDYKGNERLEYANEVTARVAKEIGGINALREFNKDGHDFGNPFVVVESAAKQPGYVLCKSVKEASDRFREWIHGRGDQDVMPEKRKWMQQMVASGALDDKRIVYYTTKVPDSSYAPYYEYSRLYAPNHAHILQDYIRESILERQRQQADEWTRTDGKKQVINIWFAGGENADLSNLAKRSFTLDGIQFNSVEQYFQWSKAVLFKDTDVATKILACTDPVEAKRLGRTVWGYDDGKWNEVSKEVMKKGITASFEQNPEARKKLLETKDAILSHHQAQDHWRIDFPQILSGVRASFLAEEQAKTREVTRGKVIVIDKKDYDKQTFNAKYPSSRPLDMSEGTTSTLGRYLNPSYPHKNIPVYNSAPLTAASVQGIWEALKCTEGSVRIEESLLDNATMKGIKREGAVKGHFDGAYSTSLLSEDEAIEKIYQPAYKWMLENSYGGKKAVSSINEVLDKGLNVVIVSDNPQAAELVQKFVEGRYPEQDRQQSESRAGEYRPVGRASEGYQLVVNGEGLYNQFNISTGKVEDPVWTKAEEPVREGYIAFTAGPEYGDKEGLCNFKKPSGELLSEEWFRTVESFKGGEALVWRMEDKMMPSKINSQGEITPFTAETLEEWRSRKVSDLAGEDLKENTEAKFFVHEGMEGGEMAIRTLKRESISETTHQEEQSREAKKAIDAANKRIRREGHGRR